MTNTPKALAFYIRVSTLSQDYKSQVHALREFCRRQGWKIPKPARWFEEKFTGKAAARTQLDALRTACRLGEVDTVLCFAIDRIGNDAANLVNLFVEWDNLKIRLVSIKDGIDSVENSAGYKMYRHMLIGLAQAARERTVERTMAGLAAARARGRIGGRKRINDDKVKQALALLSVKNPPTMRAVAAKVEVDPGYLSRELRRLGWKAVHRRGKAKKT